MKKILFIAAVVCPLFIAGSAMAGGFGFSIGGNGVGIGYHGSHSHFQIGAPIWYPQPYYETYTYSYPQYYYSYPTWGFSYRSGHDYGYRHHRNWGHSNYHGWNRGHSPGRGHRGH